MHYLDNAATTRVLPEAAEAAVHAMLEEFGNPSSLHRMGLEASHLLEDSRKTVASALGCLPEELYFTACGTESTNISLHGAAHLNRHKKGRIIVTEIEHAATINTAKQLADRLKYRKNKENNMEYKTITRPDGSEQQLAVYDGKCRFWMEGIYDSLPDTAEKRAEECSLPVKIDRRADGTVSVGTQSLVPWETDYGKLDMMADVYLNYLAQVFNLPDDGFVRTKLAFGGESAEHDGVMTAEERETVR